MKKYTTKRALAGVLAVMTVAGYAPANVGGLLALNNIAITASAASTTAFDVSDVKYVLKGISDSTGAAWSEQTIKNSNADAYSLAVGSTATIESKVPLIIGTATAAGNDTTITITDTNYSYTWDETSKNYVKVLTAELETADLAKITPADDYAVILQYLKNTATYDTYTLAEKRQVAKASYIDGYGEIQVASKGITVDGNAKSGWTYKFKVEDTAFELAMVKTAVDLTLGAAKNDTWGAGSGALEFKEEVEEPTDLEIYVESDNFTDNTEIDEDEVGQNETIRMISDDYFKAWVWNGSEKVRYVEYQANYISDKEDPFKGKYEIKLTATTSRLTKIFAGKYTPQYNFNPSADKASLTVSGSGINSTVASITGSYVEWDKEKDNYSTEKDDQKELSTNASALKNKTQVTLELTRDDKFLEQSKSAYGKLKLEKWNGKAYEEVDEDYSFKAAAWNDTDYGALTAVQYGDFQDMIEGEDTAAKLQFTEAGKYKVSYSVYWEDAEENIKTTTLNYVFEISALDALTAKNLKLKLDPTKSSSGLDEILVTDKNNEIVAKLENGVYVFEVRDGYSLNGKTVAVTAELYTDAKKQEPWDGAAPAITGELKVSSTDVQQTLTCEYEDVEYGPTKQQISVKWVVKNAAKTVYIVGQDKDTEQDTTSEDFKIGDIAGNEETLYKPADITTSIDEIDNLKQEILDDIQVFNGEKSKVTFEYVTGKGVALANDELDNHFEGLPTAVGEYSVYCVYDGDAKNVIDVTITEHSLYAAPTAAQLSLSYGDKMFTEDDLVYVDKAGKTLSDVKVEDVEISVTRLQKLDKSYYKYISEEDGKYVFKLTANGQVFNFSELGGEQRVYKFGSDYYYPAPYDWDGDNDNDYTSVPSDALEFLDAGNYIVTVKSGEDTTVSQEGYSVAKKEFQLTVAKRTITADMIMIDPVWYNDGASVDMGDIHGTNLAMGTDTVTGNQIYLKVSSGKSSGTAVGGYEVTVIPVTEGDLFEADGEGSRKLGRDSAADIAALRHAADNYTGSVKTKWYIVNKATDEDLYGFDWNDDETTIIDNGTIYFQAERPANVSNLQEYGLIYESKAKLADPGFETIEEYVEAKDNGTYDPDSTNAAVQAAYATLQYGNGAVTAVQQSPKQASQNGGKILGVTYPIKNVEIGVWARAYYITTEGKIYYTEPRYINLIDEATSKLNLKTAEVGVEDDFLEEAVTKNDAKKGLTVNEANDKATWRKDVKSGYNVRKNAIYVYASYTLEENSKLKEDAIQAFGFVADRKGKFDPEDMIKGADYEKKYAEIKKGLKINSGFSEGRSVKNNPYMDRDEVGANVVPLNAVTGVWVRAFVDYGNDVVVYTDPIYINDISAQFYESGWAPKIELDKDEDTGKDIMTVEADETGFEDEDGELAVIKKVGVTVDLNGSFLKFVDHDQHGVNYAFDFEKCEKIWQTFIAENAKTKNYSVGGKAPKEFSGEDYIYYSTITALRDKKNVEIPVVARPYVVYTIYGNDITVYGEPSASFGPLGD